MSDRLPKISLVTPSLNQGAYLRACIDSVLNQSYENLEYVIIDGGSTDDSVEIISSYRERLSYWISEPDRGQYDAINKGFSQTNGEIMGWLNSDDMHTPWAFRVVAEIFATVPEVEWLTSLRPLIWNREGLVVNCGRTRGYNREAFYNGENLFNRGFIQQESTFWRRSLWERSGGRLDVSLDLAADFELWSRFYKSAELYGVPVPLAGFRRYGNSQRSIGDKGKYQREALQVLRNSQECPSAMGMLINKVLRGRLRSFFNMRYQRRQCVYDEDTECWVAR